MFHEQRQICGSVSLSAAQRGRGPGRGGARGARGEAFFPSTFDPRPLAIQMPAAPSARKPFNAAELYSSPSASSSASPSSTWQPRHPRPNHLHPPHLLRHFARLMAAALGQLVSRHNRSDRRSCDRRDQAPLDRRSMALDPSHHLVHLANSVRRAQPISRPHLSHHLAICRLRLLLFSRRICHQPRPR